MKLLMYADCFNNKVGQTVPYMQFFGQFGEVVLVHAQSDIKSMMKIADILVVPGGADVDSSSYNQPPNFTNSRSNAHYQWLDENLLKPWLKLGLPTIGICRGMQAISCMLGGTLHQHVLGHNQIQERHKTPHTLTYKEDEDYKKVFINTMHHQAVDKLGEGLKPIGWCPTTYNCYAKTLKKKVYINKDLIKTYVLIESYKHEELPIVAFQHHPEEYNCPFAVKKIKETFNV